MSDPENPSAFPTEHIPLVRDAEPGMTLRDWLAGQVISGRVTGIALHAERMDGMAKQAYDLADAMLAERAKR